MEASVVTDSNVTRVVTILSLVPDNEGRTEDFNRLTFFIEARSSVKHSSGSSAENSWLGEPQSEGECTVAPAVRFGVVLATCLAGRGKVHME